MMELNSQPAERKRLIKNLLEQLREVKSRGAATASIRGSYLWTFAAKPPASGYEFDPIQIPKEPEDLRTDSSDNGDYALPRIKLWRSKFLQKLQISLDEGRVSFFEEIDISGTRKEGTATHKKPASLQTSFPANSKDTGSPSRRQSTRDPSIQPNSTSTDPQRLATGFQAQMAHMLEKSLVKQAKELKQAWTETHSAAVEQLEAKLQEAESRIQELQDEADGLELEVSSFPERLAMTREVGESLSREMAAKDMERELAALHRRNLDDIARVREKHDKEIAVVRVEFRRCVDRVRGSAYKEGFEDGQVEHRRQPNVHNTHQTQTPEPSVSTGSRCESLDGRSSAIASPRSVERNEPANFATPEECLGVEDQGEGPDPREDTESLEDTAGSHIPLARRTSQKVRGTESVSRVGSEESFCAESRGEEPGPSQGPELPPDTTDSPGFLPRRPVGAAYFSTLHSLGMVPFQHHKRAPRTVQSFSGAFLREYVGGTHVTFTRVGLAMTRKQIVPWPALIRVNPEYHDFAPELRSSYGALTMVEGRFTEDKDPCNTGSTFPVILREGKDAWQYIGHYTIVAWKQIPVDEWRSWSKQRRDAVVQEMHSKWGNDVLLRNGLQIFDDWPESTADQIRGFFDRESKPNLRMCLAILKFDSFNNSQYSTLVSRTSKSTGTSISTTNPAPILRARFVSAFEKWMGCFHWEPHQQFEYTVKRQRKKIRAAVLRRGHDAKMFGKKYQMGHPNTQFKHFIWELALELSTKFSLCNIENDDDMIRFLSVVAEMFDEHNKFSLSKTRTPAEPHSNPQTHANIVELTGTQQQEVPNLKREMLDDCSEAAVSKRPRLNTCIPQNAVSQVAQPRDYLLNDEIVPHAAIMNSPNTRDYSSNRATLPVSAKRKNVVAARERVLQYWSKPLPASWISRKDCVRFLDAVHPVAATMSFEDAVRQINCAIIWRLHQKDDKNIRKTPSPTSIDFRNILKGCHIPSVMSPQLLADFGLRRGPEGFLEKDNISSVVKTQPGNSSRSGAPGPSLHDIGEELYDASPRR